MPFSLTADWTVGTDADSPFKATFSDGGQVKSFWKTRLTDSSFTR